MFSNHKSISTFLALSSHNCILYLHIFSYHDKTQNRTDINNNTHLFSTYGYSRILNIKSVINIYFNDISFLSTLYEINLNLNRPTLLVLDISVSDNKNPDDNNVWYPLQCKTKVMHVYVQVWM